MQTEFYTQLGGRILELRKRSGLSQAAFAERLDVTRQAVSRWELGEALPDLDRIVKMSEVFGVSTDSLLKGADPISPEQRTALYGRLLVLCLWLSALSFLGIAWIAYTISAEPGYTPVSPAIFRRPYYYWFYPCLTILVAALTGAFRCKKRINL